MTRPLNFSFPSRRQFLVGGAATTLSAAAVALLTGHPTLAAAKGETHGAAGSDAGTLNTALALEHEAINAYTLGPRATFSRSPCWPWQSSFRTITRRTATA